MNLELTGHVAVVTGGSSGIGLACARLFLREGCRVVIWDLTPPPADLPHWIKVDVSDFSAVQEALLETGPVDHMVHAAAIGSGKFGFPFTNLDPADWSRVLSVNILGTVHVAQALAPGMREKGSGTIIFLGSVAGQIGSQTDPPYSASKAAILNFAQCVAKDLAPYGIRVNVVNPGMVQTPLNRAVWQAWHDSQPAEAQLSYEDWAGAKVRAVAPLSRWQTPEDIADLVVFLSSARAANITGQTINVDGGQVMHW